MFSVAAQAQIDMTFRRDNAVVLYEFNEASGNQVIDTSHIGSPLNLTIADASDAAIYRGTTNGKTFLGLQSRNLIQSSGPATKVIDACKASSELTIEAWFENNDPAKTSVGEYPGGTPQPNRIVTLSTDLVRNNFYMGQFYNNAELLYSAINTSGNEDMAKPGGNLNNSIMSNMNQVIIPPLETKNPPAVPMQKMLVTLAKDQTAHLYLSDRDGNLSRVVDKSNGFSMTGNALFSDWYTDAKLTLGNLASTFSEVQNAPANFVACTGNAANTNPSCNARSRYWKGKLYLVAIYCKALTNEQIIGSRANSGVKIPVIPIDINVTIDAQRLKAQDIFLRLTGTKTPIYDPVLTQMVEKLNANDPIGAAAIATADFRFINITARDFASKMSNRAETINVPLNDFTATVIGVVRDELSAQRLLTDNITYQADPTKAAVPSTLITDILRSNNHYDALDTQRVDLNQVLTRFDKSGNPLKQKVFDGTTSQDMPNPAGLLTSRGWLSAHAIAGTDRRLVEYSLREFLCTPLENVADSTGPDNVIGRDIDRFPGGSHTKFTTTCRACHTIMDGFRPAYAYITFNSDYVMHSYTSPAAKSQDEEDKGIAMLKSPADGASYISQKVNRNETVFPGGRITVDDNWVNNASYGSNASYFAWKSTSGKGLPAFGKMISESRQFPICMAKRVYTQVCKREPAATEMDMINAAASEFSTTRNYNLKYLFQRIVTSKECLGGN
jgi:hypothetical protein